LSEPAATLPPSTHVAALIVAAGSGERAGGATPKQYRDLAGRSVLARSIAAMAESEAVQSVLCVISPSALPLYEKAVSGLPPLVVSRLRRPVAGGATRQSSVLAGLEALAAEDGGIPSIILVHDAARPFASANLVAKAIESARIHGAAVPGVQVTDTVKKVDAASSVVETLDRPLLRAIQTPQAFTFVDLLAAHRRAAQAGAAGLTDDASVMEWAGHRVHVFDGEEGNVKLTTAEDIARAEARLAAPLEVRVGSGFDVHAFGEGQAVILGGLAIPHARGLSGHSDADVVLHALTDAVLGALSDGDIGSHFPPSDMQWKGASSDRFLAYAIERVRARGGRVDHLDVTVICEAPKIGPHRDAMRARIAEIAGLTLDRVAVKATTSERLGFTGRGEGIAAQATATLRLPAGD
jgi:2-C-methyl-D-erythritol 4-phosphate cytidylyltransferase/2-C-methyl-D-erythritol 2,4-cyclodiphosphate synthase